MKLKPVTIINANYSRYRQNTSQQILLLKALTITHDPQRLRELAGFKKVADVMRTLDKMTMRKEYHKALARHGIDFDYIIGGLKKEAETAEFSGDRIKVHQTLLRSLGMDKYDDPVDGGGASFEDELVRQKEEEKLLPGSEPKKLVAGIPAYEVTEPKIPESVRVKQAMEKEVGRGLYD